MNNPDFLAPIIAGHATPSRMYFELLILVLSVHPKFKIKVDRNDERIYLGVRYTDELMFKRIDDGELDFYTHDEIEYAKDNLDDSKIGWTYRFNTDAIDVWPPEWTDDKMEEELYEIMKHNYHGNYA